MKKITDKKSEIRKIPAKPLMSINNLKKSVFFIVPSLESFTKKVKINIISGTIKKCNTVLYMLSNIKYSKKLFLRLFNEERTMWFVFNFIFSVILPPKE
jgi:hypothetical protein